MADITAQSVAEMLDDALNERMTVGQRWIDLAKSWLAKDAANADLLAACKNALGAYDALLTLGIRKKLPGYDSCLNDLKAAIAKAEGRS